PLHRVEVGSVPSPGITVSIQHSSSDESESDVQKCVHTHPLVSSRRAAAASSESSVCRCLSLSSITLYYRYAGSFVSSMKSFVTLCPVLLLLVAAHSAQAIDWYSADPLVNRVDGGVCTTQYRYKFDECEDEFINFNRWSIRSRYENTKVKVGGGGYR